MGADVLALLPMMAAFLDRPCDPSPYSPISRFFWNEFYLHVPAIAEFSHCARARKLVESPGFQRKVNDFRGQPLVDYQKQMRLKRSVLERLSEFFFSTASSRRDQFERFLKTRPELRQYAAFRAVTERLHQGWRKWPERLRQGDLRPGDYDVRSEQYHMFVQWCAQQQIDSLRCASTILYLDMPLGVHADGFDTWREHEVFVTDVSGGAPPDPFFTKGQDWGFAPLHPQALRRSRYRYYIDMLRFAMRHTGLLRLDHVMGLHRLYWVPKGFPASEGAYVSYPAEELYAILCLESQRHKTALVGENLGTVPPEVNQAMARHRLSQMYVVQYEQQPYSKKCLRPPPKDSVASLNTHDMPPFSAHWKGLDVPDRVSLGLLTQEQAAAEKRRRQKNHQALAEFLRRRGFLKRSRKTSPQATIRSCLRFLSRSQAELVLVNLEDLWQEVRPQNTPGTCRERPNWRCKTRLSIEQVLASEQCRAALAEVKRLRRRAST
jgi:4-alpha-glucanotransferase